MSAEKGGETAIGVPLAAYFDCLERHDIDGLRTVFTADASGTWGPAGERS